MKFSHPDILYFLVFAPLLYLVLLVIGNVRYREREKLGNLEILNRFSSRDLRGNFRKEGLFLSLAVLFLIAALAGPQIGTRLEPVKITGSDIYIAIDLSRSMMAEDIRPNRIERAKIDAMELVKSLQGDRVGLILFAGDAYVQCPLTTDYDAVLTFLKSIDTESAVSSGTSLFAPLEVVMRSVTPEEEIYSIVLLLTDGENTEERNDRVLRELQKRGIRVFSIGIGTKEGAPIPLLDTSGRRTGYKKDAAGKVVISRMGDAILSEIARKTNGYFIEAGPGFNDIGKFVATANEMKKRELETKRYSVYEERFQLPLGIGILFLLVFAHSSVKSKRKVLQ
jgi:Ca-activated chloride channel family protein